MVKPGRLLVVVLLEVVDYGQSCWSRGAHGAQRLDAPVRRVGVVNQDKVIVEAGRYGVRGPFDQLDGVAAVAASDLGGPPLIRLDGDQIGEVGERGPVEEKAGAVPAAAELEHRTDRKILRECG